MIVFDVLREVSPGADCSHRRGVHLIDHFDREDDAERFAGRCNDCCRTPGIRYFVQAIDELSPLRHHYEYDCAGQEGGMCQGSKPGIGYAVA